jgi:hypothetical protein
MDSIGDYIYLIIIAIAGLSGFLKKKKTQTILSDEDDNDSSIFGDYKYEVPEPEIKNIEPIKNEKQTFIKSYENTSNYSDLKAKKQVSNNLKETPKPGNRISLIDDNEEANFIELNTLNDARRAFIYSEIFNKKY